MPPITIHGGDFGRRKATAHRPLLGRRYLRIYRGLFRKRPKVVLSKEVAAVRLVDASNFKDTGGAINGAFLGTVALGPLGTVAGAMLGGNKRQVSFVCQLRDGRQFVATTDRRTFDVYFMEYVGIPMPSAPEAQRVA